MNGMMIFGVILLLTAFCYAAILVFARIGLSRSAGCSGRLPDPEPFVSVIVPVRNEARSIRDCLESLVLQDYPADRFEVLISDDASGDETVTVVRECMAEWPGVPFRLVEASFGGGTGKKRAIERAVEQAKGSVLITTDADTTRGSGWLRCLMTFLEETGAALVLGPVSLTGEQGGLEKLQSLEFLGVMGLTAGFANLGIPVMGNGANLAFRKEVFRSVDGYRKNEQWASGDDQFLLWKVKQRYGGKAIRFLYDREAVVTTPALSRPGPFFSQRMRWVSKSRGYRDPVVVASGLITWLMQGFIVAGCLLGCWFPEGFLLAGGLFLVKAGADFPVVLVMAGFFGRRRLLAWYIPAQLFQVLYVSVITPLAFVIPVRWKGRKV